VLRQNSSIKNKTSILPYQDQSLHVLKTKVLAKVKVSNCQPEEGNAISLIYRPRSQGQEHDLVFSGDAQGLDTTMKRNMIDLCTVEMRL
jgi:hypothetical protein